jgi:hypothetical protein
MRGVKQKIGADTLSPKLPTGSSNLDSSNLNLRVVASRLLKSSRVLPTPELTLQVE